MARRPLSTGAEAFRMGSWGRLKQWGFRGLGGSFLKGSASALGITKTAAGWQFMGGLGAKSILKGTIGGMAAGIGLYEATGNPLLGFGGGLLGARLAAGRNATMGKFFVPGMVVASMYGGYKRGGFGGAVKAGVGQLASWGAWQAGTKALSVAFEGTAIKSAVGMIMNPYVLAAATIGLGVYKGAKYLARRGRAAQETEFTGSMVPFTTRAAATMRQRSLQEISRSHTNARTLLGQEATLMHM